MCTHDDAIATIGPRVRPKPSTARDDAPKRRKAKRPGKKRRLIQVRKDVGWNCGDRSDTEPEAVRRRV